MFSLILPAYAAKYSIDEDDLRYAVAKIAEKNHYNGARNPLAQFRREISAEQICQMAAVAGRLSVFDCAGVADGAAGAIMCRAEDAHRYCDDPLYIKALSCVAGTGAGSIDPDYDYTTLNESKWAADDAYAQADVTDPTTEIAMAEVHDCFTPTELVLMEDLGFSKRGRGVSRCARRCLRPRWPAPGQHRWRPQVFRPSGRGVGATNALRGFGCNCEASPLMIARSRLVTGLSDSRTTWVVTQGRWSALSGSMAPNSVDPWTWS